MLVYLFPHQQVYYNILRKLCQLFIVNLLFVYFCHFGIYNLIFILYNDFAFLQGRKEVHKIMHNLLKMLVLVILYLIVNDNED